MGRKTLAPENVIGKVLGACMVRSRFRITLSDSVRKLLGVEPGDSVVFVEENGRLFLEVSKKPTLRPKCTRIKLEKTEETRELSA
jgi:bifunctional DNA-binding transcriptional regulator/antitoxin component of YhaV-PrlF toxin-antitoxin module